jgi:hypothetical protein
MTRRDYSDANDYSYLAFGFGTVPNFYTTSNNNTTTLPKLAVARTVNLQLQILSTAGPS